MAYRLTYAAWVQWVGPGQGPMGGGLAVLRGSEMGGSQILELVNVAGGQNTPGLGAGGIINAAEITAITNAMAADIAAQLNANPANATVIGWPQGNP